MKDVDKEKFDFLLRNFLIRTAEFEGETYYSCADLHGFFDIVIPDEESIMLPFGKDEEIIPFTKLP